MPPAALRLAVELNRICFCPGREQGRVARVSDRVEMQTFRGLTPEASASRSSTEGSKVDLAVGSAKDSPGEKPEDSRLTEWRKTGRGRLHLVFFDPGIKSRVFNFGEGEKRSQP